MSQGMKRAQPNWRSPANLTFTPDLKESRFIAGHVVHLNQLVKEQPEKHRRGGKGKRRPLRGGALVTKAREILNEWAQLSPQTHPITLARLSRKLRVSRQALYSNGIPQELDKYKALQHRSFPTSPHAPNRKSADQQIKGLKEQITSMQQKLDGWIEKWVAVEYNARMLGIDPDQIFAQLPGPHRTSVRQYNRRKSNS
jgi:hypothetical protein